MLPQAARHIAATSIAAIAVTRHGESTRTRRASDRLLSKAMQRISMAVSKYADLPIGISSMHRTKARRNHPCNYKSIMIF